MKKYKKYFSYTTNHVDVYQHYLNEYTMYIYQNYECVNELLSDAISLDFSNCISLSNNIVIVLFVVPRQNLYGKTYYILIFILKYLQHKQIWILKNIKIYITLEWICQN